MTNFSNLFEKKIFSGKIITLNQIIRMTKTIRGVTMKKKIILFCAILIIVFGFYSQTSNATENESQSDDSVDINLPYAVNLDEWVGTIGLVDDRSHQKTAYRFFREPDTREDLPISIDINVDDLNPYGMGIYFNLTEEVPSIFYPVTIENTQTKGITILDSEEKKRKVFVNTEVTIQENADKEDVLNVVDNTYYLFYNNEGNISLAISNFEEDTMNDSLDSSAFLEYLLESTDITEMEPENNSYNQFETNNNSSILSSKTEYYDLLKKAWDNQQEYINSIEDPKIKQSLQTAQSAAIMKSEELILQNPDDLQIIQATLKEVLKEK